MDLISRQEAIKAFDPDHNIDWYTPWIIKTLEDIPAAEPEPISKEYAKAVKSWLINYQVKSAELQGRYTAYEVLGWVVNDWGKENEI